MLSNTEGDRQSEMVANTLLMDVHFWLGNFEISNQLFAKALQLYDDENDVDLAKTYAFDMKMIALVYATQLQWMMGYPDQALRTKRSADAWAKRLNTPFMYAFANSWGAAFLLHCGHLDDHRLQVEKALAVSKQVGISLFEKQAEMYGAWNQLMIGDLSEANVALFESAITHFADTGTDAGIPYLRAVHADFLAEQGKFSQALELLRNAIERVDALGEQAYAAEIHRIHATVLVREGAARWQDAERSYLTSLATSRRQGAKSWELRTATSYARMLKKQGRIGEARELLQASYDWFTEGFDTQDMKKAKALLEALSAKNA